MAPASPKSLYARVSSRWHRDIARLGYRQAYDRLAAALPDVPPGATVLDAGAGTGALALAWLKRQSDHDRLILLDNSADMLAQARTNLAGIGGADFRHAPLGTDRIGAGSVDLLLSAHVIEHLEDPQTGLNWFARCLRPGGRIALSVSKPHWCTALVRWRWGHKAFTPAETMAMLARAGFTAISEVAFVKGPPSRTSRGYIATRA